MHNQTVTSPILFLLFNRVECTRRVFAAISEAKPTKLYVAIDGPRINNSTDIENVAAVQKLVLDHIDWPCEIKTLIRDKNLGCREAVSSAISWFFEHEEEGIILEDDCLPNHSFFVFCDTLLSRYRFDERIRHISGVNFLDTVLPGSDSYYFSKFTHVWGWASWRRVWKDYDKEMKLLDQVVKEKQLYNVYPDRSIVNSLVKNFQYVKDGKMDTWDFQYLFLNFISNGLCIIPVRSMIQNIGFGLGSTHVHPDNLQLSETAEMIEMIHPVFFIPQIQYDLASFIKINNFSLKNKIKLRLTSIFQ